jgi:hypothetical protein
MFRLATVRRRQRHVTARVVGENGMTESPQEDDPRVEHYVSTGEGFWDAVLAMEERTGIRMPQSQAEMDAMLAETERLVAAREAQRSAHAARWPSSDPADLPQDVVQEATFLAAHGEPAVAARVVREHSSMNIPQALAFVAGLVGPAGSDG